MLAQRELQINGYLQESGVSGDSFPTFGLSKLLGLDDVYFTSHLKDILIYSRIFMLL